MGRRVFFLGAGATKADFPNAPTLKDVLGRILSEDLFEYTIAKDRIRNFLKEYFFDVSGKTPEEHPLIQDVLSFIDANLQSGINIRANKNELEDIRRTIVYQMGFIIEKHMQVNTDINTLKLIRRLTPEDVVISTNYDIVADNCFLMTFPNNMNYGVTFRASVDAVNRIPNSDVAGQAQGQAYCFDEGPSLLKLHGSLNWLYCMRCDELDITPGQKGALQHGTRCFRRGKCTALYQPLIVPPTFFKSYQNRIIREVWALAEEAISRATEIIFIGYSMPLDDYEVKSMLLRALSKNQSRTAINIMAVNKPENSAESRLCKLNYEKIFGHINYKDYGFEGYFNHAL